MPLNLPPAEAGALAAAGFGLGVISTTWYYRAKGWLYERRRRDREPEAAAASANTAGVDLTISTAVKYPPLKIEFINLPNDGDCRTAAVARVLNEASVVKQP